MQGPVEPRWWRRRRDLALHAAREAAAAAAVALLRLDGEQRSTASHLAFVAGPDAGPIASQLRARWEPVSTAADTTISAYLEAVTRWDVNDDLELESATAAAAAFSAHAEAMDQAVAGIERWAQESNADFVGLNRAIEKSAELRRRAEQALTATHEQLVATERDGSLAPHPRTLLEQALDRFRVVEEGPQRHGRAEVLRACEDAVALAGQASAALQALPGLRLRVEHRTLSVQTRLSALASRVQDRRNEDVLHTLRRDYVLACSQDLDDSEAQARAALDRARTAVGEAAAAAGPQAQRWDDALAHLTQARQALDQAQERIEEPGRRLALLQSVAADPRAASAAARFALRDARNLLLSAEFDPRQGRTLDSLAGRLESVGQLLDRPHPDWLTYAHTLDAIVDGAHGLVVDIRASRAR